MPIREINKKFVKSEIVITAWRSQEISFKMGQKTETSGVQKTLEDAIESTQPGAQPANRGQGKEFNMNELSGKQARAYLRAVGIPI